MLDYRTAVILLVFLIGEISGNESGDGPPSKGARTSVQGTLDVTLLMFSGEPDPEWQITPSNPNYQKIQTLLESARKGGFSYGEDKIPMELGYKGFLVKTAPTTNSKAELILGRNTVELQKLFLQTMPKYSVFKDHVSKVIKQVGSVTKAIKKTLNVGPTFDVLPWSEPGIKEKNNCYNYATNVAVLVGPAKPGRGGGNEIVRRYTGEQVRLAAESDGLMTVSKLDEPPLGGPFIVPKSHKTMGAKRYFVALFVKNVLDVAPEFGNDFHWYRRDNNKLWSHKLGKNVPTNRDFPSNNYPTGALITDPRLANRKDKAYKFICFMTVDPDLAPLKIQ